MRTLQEVFDQFGCDKGSKRHRYDRVYEPVFKSLRSQEFNMLEVGILRGESLESHLAYFPHATFYGIDIFGRVPAKDVPALKHDRVKWCKCDSIKGPNEDFRNLVGDIKFDVIIDDGLHTHDSQRCTFENLIPYLKEDGVYFIEDVWPFDRMSEQEKKHQWVQKHAKEYTDEKYGALLNALEPYDVKFHDMRDGFHPDTFIIEIRKK